MKTLEVRGESLESFNQKVNQALQNRALGKIVTFSRQGQDLLVKFEKLGTSEIQYRVTETGQGFTASLLKEKIAFTHKAFRGDIEGKLEKVLTGLGAIITR